MAQAPEQWWASSTRSGRPSARSRAELAGRVRSRSPRREPDPAALGARTRSGGAARAAPTSTSTPSPPTASAGSRRSLAWVMERTQLDVIAIADHERVDAAHAARAIALARDLPVEVVIGEEVSTRGGHLLALFIEEPVPPLRSLRESIALVHEQGGLAIPAHPLFPYPMCAQAWVLRGLLASPDARVRPDAVEAFNPTTFGRPVHRRVVAFAAEHGLAAVGNSDAHEAASVGIGWTTFPGRTAEDLRAAILGAPAPAGTASFHGTTSQLPTFGRQLRKYGRDARAEVLGRVRRDGTGRDLGYPGGALRPPRLDEAALGTPRGRGSAVKIGLVTPYVYPLPGGVNDHVGQLYASLRTRGPRRADPDGQPRPPAQLRGRRHPDRQGVLGAGQRLRGHADDLAALPLAGPGRAGAGAVRPPPLPRAVRAVPDAGAPSASPTASTSPRSTPTPATLRATSSGAGCSARWPPAGCTGGSPSAPRRGTSPIATCRGDYKVIPNGVDLRLFDHAVPLARWQDGRPNILFVGRFEPQEGAPRPAQGLPHRPQGRRGLPAPGGRLGPARARGATVRDDPPPGRGGVPGPGLGPGEGAAVQDGGRVRLAGDRARELRDRAPRGDGGRDGHRLQRHPRLQGRREARRAGPAGAAGRPPGARRGDPPPGRRPGPCGRA